MKRGKGLAAGFVMAFGLGTAAWRVSAQTPEIKAAETPDPLAGWLYPGAGFGGESNHERLKDIPLHAIQETTHDSLEKTYFFYRKKAEPSFVAGRNAWNVEMQPTMLMNQLPHGANSTGFIYAQRKQSDSALLVIRQAKRTITVQLSRDAKDASKTDILLVADEH